MQDLHVRTFLLRWVQGDTSLDQTEQNSQTHNQPENLSADNFKNKLLILYLYIKKRKGVVGPTTP